MSVSLKTCNYYVVIYSLCKNRRFTKCFMTLEGARNCAYKYVTAKWHIELHDRIGARVLLVA